MEKMETWKLTEKLSAAISEFRYRDVSFAINDSLGKLLTTPKDVLHLLQEMSNLLKNNSYLKLPPITPGITPVWAITDTGHVQECHVGCFIINGNGATNPDAIEFTVLDTGYDGDEPVKRTYMVQDLGKSVWLTKEEATFAKEKRLLDKQVIEVAKARKERKA